MLILVPGLRHHWARLPDNAGAWLPFALMLGILLAVVGTLYRNLLFRDTLTIVRGEGTPGQRLTCFAGEIVSVRRLPTPEPSSPAGKWTALGLGQGLIEIRTADACFRFGVGLDDYALDATTERIAAFCGLQWR
ncbi:MULTISPECIES: hypothetical protein [unclassified Massilia]|uniref:hypothetical protein n=1 Tax=unclassified Massilia TaxID=2609279 RepID=UPI001781E341|nr:MULTISPECIES: hypothetical protein [unclassified Massilia]MBD8532737.1 hypothetical protein [Massilia sp. CFBP 13647]MBD8676146.1 hypothetical protein [Massilia sp. CFBP 13721]